MTSPHPPQPIDPVHNFVRRYMDGYIDERPSFGELPEDMLQFLCRLIAEVSILSDADAEAAMVAHDPELDYRHFCEATPNLLKKDPQAWSDNYRYDLRQTLAHTRLEHELPMFLPHYTEGDYTETDQFSLAIVMTSHVLARCFQTIELRPYDPGF